MVKDERMSKVMEWLYNHLLVFVNVCISIFETYIFWDVGKSFLTPRVDSWWKRCLILFGMVLLNRISNIWGNPTVVLVTFFLIYFVGGFVLFVGTVKGRIIYTISFVVIQCASEMILYLIAFGVGISDITNEAVWRYTSFGMISKLLAFLILLLGAKGFSDGQIGQLPWKAFGTYLVMPASSMFILFAVMSFQDRGNADRPIYVGLLISSIAVLFANAVLLHIFEAYAASMELTKRFELKEQRASLEIKQYRQLELLNLKNDRYLHDIKYILQSAESLLACGEITQTREILNNATKEIIDTNQVRYCSNSVVNAILCSKRSLAESMGIDYQVEVEALMSTGNLNPEEIIIVLGNLLDNAIEAAGEVMKEGFVKTSIEMRNRGSFLHIYVENNYETEPKKYDGYLISRKRGHKQYGHGLDSIRTIVERCNGIEDISYENKIFVHQVVLSTM